MLQIRTYGDPTLPAIIYLPGLHGDWTLVGAFRAALGGQAFFVEMTYPRSLTWSISEYASAIEIALLDHGISQGWLIGESFGSQIAWGMMENDLKKATSSSRDTKSFHINGMIFAGGFVKHPWPWGPPLLRFIGWCSPAWFHALGLKIYAQYAKIRHHQSPEVMNSVKEFIERRTEQDRKAIAHRLRLINEFDARATANKCKIPVYYLAGLVDPLVPWMLVRRWLGKHCPGYRGGKTVWKADHNVLATAPAHSSEIILNWINHHH